MTETNAMQNLENLRATILVTSFLTVHDKKEFKLQMDERKFPFKQRLVTQSNQTDPLSKLHLQ